MATCSIPWPRSLSDRELQTIVSMQFMNQTGHEPVVGDTDDLLSEISALIEAALAR